MLVELFPRTHRRFSSLPLLGPYVDDFIAWLRQEGYPRVPIRRRVQQLPYVDRSLRRRGVLRVDDVSHAQLALIAPQPARNGAYLAAVVRSLDKFFTTRNLLRRASMTRSDELVREYRAHLVQVRGLAATTVAHHASTVAELLDFLRYNAEPRRLQRLKTDQIDAFLTKLSQRVCRETLQHVVARVRSFLRFLVRQGVIAAGADITINTPRVYRGEKLPRSLPWSTVRAFLAAIDRTTATGRRDYAMFLLITTYGLRTSEVAALKLENIEWRAGLLRVWRPKSSTPIMLPLTKEVGAAIAEYLRRDRPKLSSREVFMRMRAPAGKLAPTAVTEAFQKWTRCSGLPIPFQGPHCLRHSLAVHLLRQGTSLKAIGDLLGHRSSEATCVYLRLHVEDLRDATLEVPTEVGP